MDQGKNGFLVYYPEGSLVQVTSDYYAKPKTGGGTRSVITGFSRESRKRMMDTVNRIKHSEIRKANLITLTYHENYEDHKISKKHLDAFKKRLVRHNPSYSGIWKLEYQQRGAIHYHIVQFGGFIRHADVARWWNDITDPGNESHLRAGTQIKRVQSATNGQAYICKYLSKLDPGVGRVRPSERGKQSGGIAKFRGRYWGVFNRKRIPFADPVVVHLGEHRAAIVKGQLSAKLGLSDSPCKTRNVYTRGRDSMQRLLESIESIQE